MSGRSPSVWRATLRRLAGTPSASGETGDPRASGRAVGARADARKPRPLSGGPLSPELSVDFLTELFRDPLDAGYADAAATRKRSGRAGVASRRAGFALRTVTLVAAGLLLAVAYQQTVAAQPEAAKTRNTLVQDVKARQAETDAQQRQAELLRQQAAKLRDAFVGPNASTLDQIEARAGLGAVSGDGVTVTLASGPAPTDPVTGKAEANDQGHIVDFDLQVISNELWRDGAEAISINGQRLIATSTIRAAGNAILVDLAPLSEPYTIRAIGPSKMADALRKSAVGGFYRYLATSYGVNFAVHSADGLTLGAAADPDLRYATAVKGSSGAPSSSTSRPHSGSPRSSPSARPTTPGGH